MSGMVVNVLFFVLEVIMLFFICNVWSDAPIQSDAS